MQAFKRLLRRSFVLIVMFLFLGGCVGETHKKRVFNPNTCLSDAHLMVEGIEVLEGPRSKNSIAADMRNAYCNGQVLLKKMNENGESITPGTIWFKVSVEYTGEVIRAKVIRSEISSKRFSRKVADMIMDTDFSPWQRNDTDALFIYPMTFDRWWESGE